MNNLRKHATKIPQPRQIHDSLEKKLIEINRNLFICTKEKNGQNKENMKTKEIIIWYKKKKLTHNTDKYNR